MSFPATYLVAAASWALAGAVMFAPGAGITWIILRRRGRRLELRRRIQPYSHIPGRIT